MKLKKWLLGLVTFAAMAVLCVVCAGAETYGDFEYDVLDSGTVKITKYNGNAEKVDIPKTIEGKSVTSIGESAFINCKNLTSITIPNSVTKIGMTAFLGCSNLTGVTLPNGLTEINYGIFEYCTSLVKITIPNSVKEIGYAAFGDCSSLTDIVIPNSVENIAGRAFENCSNITSITMPNSVTSIGEVTFGGCSSLTDIVIPNSVTEIGWNAFDDCESLTRITIPNSVTSIGSNAFINCTALTAINVASQNKNYTSENGVLFNKDKTELICYPGGKTDNHYEIPNSVTSIGSSAFYGCSKLTSIFIPDSVSGKIEFGSCSNLTTIDVATNNVDFSSENGVLFDKNKTALICYPSGKTENNYNIPDSVTSIGNSAFSGCTSLTSVTIPNSVTEIHSCAFEGCTSLKTVTIPNGVTYIGSGTFSGCTSLTSITIPNSVTYIDYGTFSGCTSLTSITIPNSVTYIYDDAFSDCTSLISITIPDSVTYIGGETFRNCISLTAINVATGNQDYASANGVLYDKDKTAVICYPVGKKDKNYSILDSVTHIYRYAFRGCTNLTSITIPDSVTYIGDYAFENCTSLAGITIPDGVTEISQYAFDGCTSLASITIPKSVTFINNGAFLNCTSLTSVTIPDGVTYVSSSAFGYYYDDDGYKKKLDDLKIYCYSGTEGEKYAIDNGFDYVLLDKLPTLAKVGGFKVKAKGSTSITLQWNKNTSASGYEIEQYKGGKWVNVAKITGNATTSYTVKGLAAGTAGYKFRMRAVKDGVYSDYTSALSVNTNPYGVGGFKCLSKTSTSVTLKWNKGTTASGYELQQYKNGKWVTIYTGTKATNTSYTVKNLKAGTAGYRFKIRAYKTYGSTKQYGSWSSEVKVNTNPYGVGGFKCTSKSSTSVTLKWNKGTTASGYELQQYKNGKWVTIYTGTKATNTSYTVKNLKAGTAGYRFKIRAYKTYGSTKQYSSWSSEIKVNTNPYGVSGFKCSSKTSTSVTLKWNKGTTASGYQLQQYKNGKWVTIYTGTKATSTSYTVKNLKAGTAGYRFRIRAYKTYGSTKQYGSWSKEVKVNTNPYGVGGFKIKATAKTGVKLVWNKGTTASGYQLQQYKNGKWVTIYTGTKATSTSYIVKGLKANTSYKFRIRAYKTYGSTKQYSSWSSTLTVKTKK